jgi:hypothetical protein
MRSYFLGDLSCAQQGVLREALTLDATTVAEARTHLFHPTPTIVTVRFILRMLVGMVRENADLEALSLIREFHGSSQIARREAAKAIAELGDARDLKQLRKSAWEGREYASGEDVSRSLLRALWKHGGTLGRGEALLRVVLRPLRIQSLFKGLFESSEMRLSACSENAGD